MNLSTVVCAVLLVESVALAQGPSPAEPVTGTEGTPGVLRYAPMTQGEQFHYFLDGTFSAESVIRAAAGAAILQAMNTPGEWGQGVAAYGERFANDYAQHIIRQSLLYGLSDLLHEDNRYFASGLSGTAPRVKYAIESTFLARKPDGHRRLSYSRLSAVAATAFLSREWQPRSTAGSAHAWLSIGTVLGGEAAFNVAREFLPRVFRTVPRALTESFR